MVRYLIVLGLCLPYLTLFSQLADDRGISNIYKSEPNLYDGDLLNPDFHKKRREELRKLMPDSSVAIFFSYPVRNRSNDVDYEYHQNPNLYYLTGLNEPNSVLVIFKTPEKIGNRESSELIFVQPRDSASEIWNGKRLGVDGVINSLKMQIAYENKEFADMPLDFSKIKTILHEELREDISDNKNDKGDLASLQRHFLSKTDSISSKRDSYQLKNKMAILREIKTEEEIKLLRQAILLTCDAQKEVMKALLPGMKEYESEAIVEYIFKNGGAEYPGFPSIVGGGENSCILHYTTNRKTVSWDDLMVCDIGAEYHGYTADVTRTLPVSGEFNEEQKIIYEIVLEAQQAGIDAAIAGNKFWEPHNKAKTIIQQRLLEQKIITDAQDVSLYFMHGTSHYLGLDVHDLGTYNNLQEGNVITVEPGIYISKGSPCDPKWWNIGVRIEDDILITKDKPEVLSACCPKKIEEIEKLMKEESIFNTRK